MTKYRVDGPERWGSCNQTSGCIITCKVCKKKIDLSESYRLWPDKQESTYLWVCSEKCVTFAILQGEDSEK